MIRVVINSHLHTVSIPKCDIKRSLWIMPKRPNGAARCDAKFVDLNRSDCIRDRLYTDSRWSLPTHFANRNAV